MTKKAMVISIQNGDLLYLFNSCKSDNEIKQMLSLLYEIKYESGKDAIEAGLKRLFVGSIYEMQQGMHILYLHLCNEREGLVPFMINRVLVGNLLTTCLKYFSTDTVSKECADDISTHKWLLQEQFDIQFE